MKRHNKRIGLKIIFLLVLSLCFMLSFRNTADAATFNDINASNVFLKQTKSDTCTLCAATMMVRRTAMATGNASWSNITEANMRGTAWLEGSGLYYSFTYAGVSVKHASLPGGSSNTGTVSSLLASHPEGIVIYNTSKPHAILVTDYTNGVFYCADPANNIASGRINISSASITLASATEYWYVNSPKVSLTPDDTKAPTIKNVRVSNVSSSGYTVTCDVSDDIALKNVTYVTWTPDVEGFDDKKEETVSLSGTSRSLSYTVKTSDHNNEKGRYATHIYLRDAAGHEVSRLTNTAVEVKAMPDKTIEYNGHKYALYNVWFWNWTTAKTYCESMGGNLVTITSQGEQDAVNSLLKSATLSGYWIGSTDEVSEGSWKWVTGTESFKWSNWVGQPDNYGNVENYGMLFADSGKWNDVPEDVRDADGNGVYGFICEYGNSAGPVIKDISISDASADGYTINIDAVDFDNIDHMVITSWTPDNGGYDDKKDYTLNNISSNHLVTSYRVKASDHNNEKCRYASEIYLYDVEGNCTFRLVNALVGIQKWGIMSNMVTYGGHTYLLFDQKFWNWTTAKTYCDSVGGNLVTITSEGEQEAINRLLEKGTTDAYWIGATDEYQEGEWTWVTGENFKPYSNWTGQPDNYGNVEHYGTIFRSTGKWNDVPEDVGDAAGNGAYGFICEIPREIAYPAITNVKVTNVSASGYTITCDLSAGYDYKYVEIQTWTKENDNDDLKIDKIQPSDISENRIVYRVKASDHNNETGRYYTHIYLYDIMGNNVRKCLNLAVGEDPSVSPDKEVYYKGHKYILYNKTFSYWQNAESYCDSLGGHLVTITSEDEQDVVYNLIQNGDKSEYWIGCTDECDEGEWIWVTGETTDSYSNWVTGQPDNYEGLENFGIIKKSTGKWNDVQEEVRDENGNGAYGFICEIEIEKPLSECSVVLLDDQYVYNGTEIKPALTITDRTAILTEGTDYELSYDDNINAGTATVTATGLENSAYTGSVSKTFTITKAPQVISNLDNSYNVKIGDTIKLNPSASSGGNISYSSGNPGIVSVDQSGYVTALEAGTANITVSASETANYLPAAKTVQINAMATDLSGFTAAVSGTAVYTGNVVTPDITVKNGSTILNNGTDYTVSYSNNVNAGTATATITGIGKYTGTITKMFSISKADQIVTASVPTTYLKAGADTLITASGIGTVSYVSDNEDVAMVSTSGKVVAIARGTVIVTITASGDANHNAGTKTIEFTVTEEEEPAIISLDDCVVTVASGTYTYDGTAKIPAVTVKNGGTTLIKDSDYTLTYSNNISAGTAYVSVAGIGGYTGTVNKTFTIEKADQTVTASISPDTLVEGTTAQITASGIGAITYESSDDDVAMVNSNGKVAALSEGEAEITVKASGDQNHNAASRKLTVKVTKKAEEKPVDISECTVIVTAGGITYDGTAKEVAVTVIDGNRTLTKGTDYTVTYSNNINAGTAKATVTGTGRYEGSVEKTFTISKASQTIQASISSDSIVEGTTAQITASGIGTITYESSDDDVAMVNSNGKVAALSEGEAEITVKASGDQNHNTASRKLAVKVTKKAEEKPMDILECTVIVTAGSITYDGTAKEVSVIVIDGNRLLTKEIDYTVSYSNNVNAGTAKVIVSGIGRYEGNVENMFTISKASQTLQASITPDTLVEGTTAQITASGIGTITYESSDDDVAMVNVNGKVAALSEGEAEITITAAGNENYISATAKIIVTVVKEECIHDWGTGEIMEQPTCTEKGLRKYTCSKCSETKTEEIPEAGHKYVSTISGSTKTYQCSACGDNYSEVLEKDSAEYAENKVISKTTDSDPTGAIFNKLAARIYTTTSSSITIKWKKVSGATNYYVYAARCNTSSKKYKFKKVKTASSGTTSFKYTKLAKGVYYKFIVMAVKETKVLSTSKTMHIVTYGGKNTNVKSLTLNKTKLSLKKGRKYTVKVKSKTLFKKGKKNPTHRKTSYESSNKNIATVSSTGVIKGIKKGTCYIYVYVQDGAYKSVKVTVK